MLRNRRKLWLLVLCGLGALILVASCAPAAKPTTPALEPKYGGILRLDQAAVTPHLNPLTRYDSRLNNRVGLVYNRLLTYKAFDSPEPEGEEIPDMSANRNDMTPVPDLAERWEVSPDGMVYTFYLRKGVKFHNIPPVNGREMTSDDVKFTFEKVKDPATKSPNAYTLDFVDRIEAPDKYTVKFTMKKPFAPQLFYFTHAGTWVMPRELIEQGKPETQAIGTGPFILEKFDPDVKTTYKKNPDYWNKGFPYLDGVEYLVIKDPSTELAAFRAGELDLIFEDFRAAEVEATRKVLPDVVVYKGLQAPYVGVGMGQKTIKPLQDVRVRKAINLVIDRQDVIKTVYQGYAKVAGIPPPSQLEFAPTPAEIEKLWGTKVDVTQAKKLMAEAGYPNGFKARLNHAPFGETYVDMAQLLAGYLKQIGIETEFQRTDRALYDKLKADWSSELEVGTLQGTYFEPDQTLYLYFHSKGAENRIGVQDPKLDELLEKQRTALKTEDRIKIIKDISNYLAEQLYVIPVAQNYELTAQRGYVKNYQRHSAQGLHWVYRTWLAK